MEEASARMRATNLRLTDFDDIPNALLRFENPVSVDARASFDIRWSGPVTGHSKVTTPRSSGELFFVDKATMRWSASNATRFMFRSDPPPRRTSSPSSVT